jgi:hypothetical protein
MLALDFGCDGSRDLPEARAPDAGFDIGSDRLGETELRREQQLFDITDEGVVLEILYCDDRRCLLQMSSEP